MVNQLCQASPAGVRDIRYIILEPHIASTGSKGPPVEVANHLTYTARVMETVASVSCSSLLIHLVFVYFFICISVPDRAYSRYSCVFNVWDAVLKYILRRPRILLAFLVALLMWVFHFRSEVSVMSRYLAGQ